MTPLTVSVTVVILAGCAYEHRDRGQCAPVGAELWKMENNAVRETELYRNLMYRQRMFNMCENARLNRVFKKKKSWSPFWHHFEDLSSSCHTINIFIVRYIKLVHLRLNIAKQRLSET